MCSVIYLQFYKQVKAKNWILSSLEGVCIYNANVTFERKKKNFYICNTYRDQFIKIKCGSKLSSNHSLLQQR